MTDIHEILQKYWGYGAFRPLQEDIVRSVLAARDTLALLPTGGGKSICFQVPVMAAEGAGIVVTPLIALMKDQVEQLKKRDIPAVAIYSGMSRREIDIALDNCVYGKVKFLYVSPERIQTEIFRERVKRMKVALIAVDEAHCISQWGYDFRPSYLKIAELRALLPSVPVIALTATATEPVKKDIQEKLVMRDAAVFQKSYARSNLSYSCFLLSNKEQKVCEILNNVPGTSVIYVRSRKKTQEVASFLRRNRISADYYHAGLSFEERVMRQDNWIGNKTRVIVATNAFGMGIDKPDVRTVIHWELPENLEAYYQEAGRAGRDEKKAFAVLLFNEADVALIRKKTEEAYPPVDFIRKVYQSLANYYKIAVGSSNLSSYDFDPEEFENVYKLPRVETFYALKRLESEGFIQMNDGFAQPSRLYILMNQQHLYEFQVANPRYDPLIKTILRMYGGELFTGFCVISERQIAFNFRKPQKEVEEMLRGLEKLEVLEYQPRKDKTQLVFTTPRMDASRLPLNAREMELKKKADLEKVNAVVHYAEQSLRCRTQVLLDYFGEVSDQECGVCDVCIRKKKERHRDDLSPEIRSRIIMELKKELINIDLLSSRIPGVDREELVKVVRVMADAGEVIVNEDGCLLYKEH